MKTSGKPKRALDIVHNEVGGSLGATSASELPHGQRQVYNVRQRTYCSGEVQTSTRHDPFFDLIKTCKEDNLPGGRAVLLFGGLDYWTGLLD